jgi:inhibitor of cysteine peptidase
MEWNPFSRATAVLVLAAVVLGGDQLARAALCGKCRDLMFVESPGKCRDCGAPTASGALQLCPKCSARRHRCEHCLAATTTDDEAASQDKPAIPPPDRPQENGVQEGPAPAWTAPANGGDAAKAAETPAGNPANTQANPLRPATEKPDMPVPPGASPESKPPAELPPDAVPPLRLKPINPARAGVYTAEKWRYQMQITSPGTHDEGRWGWLSYDGQKLPRGDVNDYYNTPWGPLYWVDVPTTAWGVHGWMPVPLAGNRRQGKTLLLPSSLASQPATATRPASPSATAPAKPRVQTLQINKSHNGQLARVRVGNVLVIRLPGDPATGYQWRLSTSNTPAVRLTVRPQYSPPASSAAGAATPGTYTFVFQAVQPGSGSIRLHYVRPSDPGRPRDTFSVGVNVSPALATAAASRPLTADR